MQIDDFSDDDYDVSESSLKIVPPKNCGLFTGTGLTTPIVYNNILKRFVPGNLANNYSGFMGWMMNYDNKTDLVDVLYRGFLMKDSLKFSLDLKPKFIQNNIYTQFLIAKNTIIENMPRVKKLKRLNLKMITREHAAFIYSYLDSLIDHYEIIYGYENAQILKAELVTQPFYVNDNGIIKLYNISTNELTIPDLESHGFFLAYFSFVNKTQK